MHNCSIGEGNMKSIENHKTKCAKCDITEDNLETSYLERKCIICSKQKKVGVTLHDEWICQKCCVACSVIVKCGQLEQNVECHHKL